MHPVLGHIFARKNKKVPTKDGLTIALVNFGGFMSGVRSAGAMAALLEMGFGQAFDSIYTISSGFFNASSFLSGDGLKNVSVYYEDLCSKKFFNPFRFWKLIDSDYLISVLQKQKNVNVSNILDQSTKLYLRLNNLTKNLDEYLEVHNFKEIDYVKLFKAAASAPFFAPGYVKIGTEKFKDPIARDSQTIEHVTHVLKTAATDILIVYNEFEQYECAKTILNSFDSKRIYNIFPAKSSIWDRVESNPKKLKDSALEMGKLTKMAFGLNEAIKLYGN